MKAAGRWLRPPPHELTVAMPETQPAAGAAPPQGATGRRRLLAQARFWLAFTLVLIGVILWTRAGFAIPANTIAAGQLPLVLAMVSALAYAVMGLLLSLRRPEVRIGAIEAWVGVVIGGLALAWAYLAFVTSPAGIGSGAAPYVALAAAVVITPVIAALAVGLVLLFPTDRLLSPAWRRVIWVAVAGVAVAGVGRLLKPGALTFVGDYSNPIGMAGLGALPAVLQLLGYVALGVAATMAGVCVLQRYLAGGPVEQAQLRVFAAVAATGAVVFVLFVATFLVPDVDTGVRDGIVVLNLVVVAIGPFALALAIARYRLWEMDHLVGRTFVYGALTAILAGLYAASIRLLQAVFVFLTGEGSEASLVITTLILATTFTPIKNRLDKVAAAWTSDPAYPVTATPAPAAAGTSALVPPAVADASALGPPAVAAGLLDDPAFAAALDERILAVVRAESAAAQGTAAGAEDPSGPS
jgi:FtsH-binding integral membrane protein